MYNINRGRFSVIQTSSKLFVMPTTINFAQRSVDITSSTRFSETLGSCKGNNLYVTKVIVLRNPTAHDFKGKQYLAKRPKRVHQADTRGSENNVSWYVLSQYRLELCDFAKNYINYYIVLCARYFFGLTNRFHVSVRLFSNRSQMTSKCGKNKKAAHEAITECV